MANEIAVPQQIRACNERRGREWSRREPSDIDEARKGELSGESESIEPAWQTKSPFLNKSAPAMRGGGGNGTRGRRATKTKPDTVGVPEKANKAEPDGRT